MSIQAKLHLDEQAINIEKYKFSVTQNADYTGKPSAKPVAQPIEFTYKTIKNDPFLRKLISGEMTDYIKLVLSPVLMDSRSTTIELLDFYVISLHEIFNSIGTQPSINNVVISFATIIINGEVANVKYWKKTDPFAKEVTPTVIEEEKEPRIAKINWIDPKTKKEINKIPYDEELSLQVEIRNAIGGTVSIIIKKEDGNELEKGKKELSFIEAVDENGIVNIPPFLVERVWEDGKVQTYDYLVAEVTYNGKTKESKEIILIPFTQVIVDFRPKDKYDGSYGFDYLRDKRTKRDKVSYKNLLREVIRTTDPATGKYIYEYKEYTTDTVYNKLKDTEYKPLKWDWYKEFAGDKQLEYPQSYLTIYPKKSVTLSLKIETLENPKELTFEYDKNYFTLNKQTIPAQNKGKKTLKDYLTITCDNEFAEDQIIKVMYKDRLLGQLNILKNDIANRKKAKVVFVQVKTEINSGKPVKGKLTTKSGKPEKEMLERLLKQAYIKVEYEEFLGFNPTAIIDPITNKPKYPDFNNDYTLLDVTKSPSQKIIHKYNNSTGDQINIFMEKVFNLEHPEYEKYFKVFFFGDEAGRKDDVKIIQKLGGFAKEIGSLSVSVFKGRQSTDVTHELLHAMGLYHSFKDLKYYSFKEGATKNIMDYSTNKNNTWKWQWKKIRKNPNILKE